MSGNFDIGFVGGGGHCRLYVMRGVRERNEGPRGFDVKGEVR
jgi:hypothetical protein